MSLQDKHNKRDVFIEICLTLKSFNSEFGFHEKIIAG